MSRLHVFAVAVSIALLALVLVGAYSSRVTDRVQDTEVSDG